MKVMALLWVGLFICGCDQLGLTPNTQQQVTVAPAVPPGPVNALPAAAPAPASPTVAEMLNQAEADRQMANIMRDQGQRDRERWNQADEQLRADQRAEGNRESERGWREGREAYNADRDAHEGALAAGAARRRADEAASRAAAEQRRREDEARFGY